MVSPVPGDFLIIGYARRHCLRHIPTDIEELIHLFWSTFDGIWWKIKGKELKKFFNMKQIKARKWQKDKFRLFDDNHISGQKIEIHSMCITPIIYNSFGYEGKNRVMNFELLFNIPPNVQSIEVYYKLYCKETDTILQKMCCIENSGICASDELKIVLYAKDMKGMNKLSEVNVMHFCEIYRIEYKAEAKRKTYFKEVEMLQNFEYEWKLNEKEIKMLKRCPDKYEYETIKSDLFNNGWFQMKITPTRYLEKWGYLGLYVPTLTRLKNIARIQLKAEIVIGTKSVCSEVRTITLGYIAAANTVTLTQQFDDFIPEIGTDCSIHAKFEITAICIYSTSVYHRSYYWNKIVGAEMGKYGIVLNSPSR